jgi:hypothetical protein
MEKRIPFILLALFVASNSLAATNFMPKRFNTVTSHEDVYPYRLNNAKPNDGQKIISTNTINSNSAKPIGKRGVIKRKTNARAATTSNSNYNSNDYDNSTRRVVQRNNTVPVRSAATKITPRTSNDRDSQNVVARSGRTRTTNTSRTTVNYSGDKSVSSQRCFADYKECMEMYCLHEDTAYNRCYCSAKLAQIDAKYQNKIDNLIQQIIRLQYGNNGANSEEIKEYWDASIGVYTETNPWVNIENALNIDWADSQSRIRGQNAFNTGHEYCIQHLRACSYMASNMRDAYKSEIARDCETYEKGLQKIQNAAESVIESYKN